MQPACTLVPSPSVSPLSASLDFVTRPPALHLTTSCSLRPCPGAPMPLSLLSIPSPPYSWSGHETYKVCDPLPWGSWFYVCFPFVVAQHGEHLILGGMIKRSWSWCQKTFHLNPSSPALTGREMLVCIHLSDPKLPPAKVCESPPQPTGCHCPHHDLINRGEV